MKRRATKKRGGTRGGPKTGSTPSTSKNEEAVVETSTQETQPTQETATQETQPSQEAEEAEAKVESPTHAKEGENEEEAEEIQEEEAAKVEPKPVEEGENEEEAKEDQEEEKEDAKPDSATHQVKDESASKSDEAKGASSSKPELRRGKRKRATKTEESEKKPTPRAKRARTSTKPQEAEPEYFKEKRNLEDLWKAAFPVGTEWEKLDALYEFNWDFSNVEEALEEGGKLYGKKVYVFGCTESHSVRYKNKNKDVLVPAVVCIESSIPPSDKIGVASVQGEVGEVISMKSMKMAWVPYIPLEKRDRQVDKMNFKIFILGCSQRRSALKHLKDDRVKKFNYCLPYINNPFKVDESALSTVVQIMFPSEPPVECEYDWVNNDIEEFTDNLIEEEALLQEQKDAFEEFVKEQSDKAKTAYEEAQEAREKAKEEMSEETKKAYEEMKFYKFYPLSSPDTPDTAGIEKSPFINRYFGKAHEVL